MLKVAAADAGPVKLITLVGAHAYLIGWLVYVITQLAPLYPSRGIVPTVAMAAGLIGVLAVDIVWIVQLIGGRANWREHAARNRRNFDQACQDFTVLDDAYKTQALELKDALERNERQYQTIIAFGEIEGHRAVRRAQAQLDTGEIQ